MKAKTMASTESMKAKTTASMEGMKVKAMARVEGMKVEGMKVKAMERAVVMAAGEVEGMAEDKISKELGKSLYRHVPTCLINGEHDPETAAPSVRDGHSASGAPLRRRSGASSWPTRARSFSTRSETSRWSCSPKGHGARPGVEWDLPWAEVSPPRHYDRVGGLVGGGPQRARNGTDNLGLEDGSGNGIP